MKQLPLLSSIYDCRIGERPGERYAGPFGSPAEAERQPGRKGAVIVETKPSGERVTVCVWRGGRWVNAVGGG